MSSRRFIHGFSALILAGLAAVGGCKKSAEQTKQVPGGNAPPGSAAATRDPVPNGNAALGNEHHDQLAAIDPFQPAVRFDPEKLPAICDAMVMVVTKIEGRPDVVQTAFVFDADEHKAYIAAFHQYEVPNGPAAQPVGSPQQASFQAVVGSGAKTRVVPLQIARRYIRSGGIVLSAAKSELPQPLPARSGDEPPPVGRRLHLVGCDALSSPIGDQASSGYARFAEPVWVVPAGADDVGRPILFQLDQPPSARARSGLVIADDGTLVALGHTAQSSPPPPFRKFYACLSVECLRRFKEPELTQLVAQRRRSNDEPPRRAGPAPVEAIDLEVFMQCVEYPQPLVRPSLLISAEPMNLSSYPVKSYTAYTSWLGPDSVGVPRRAIIDGKWEGQPADAQSVPLKSIPTTEILTSSAIGRRPKTDGADPIVDPIVATYHAEVRITTRLPNPRYYVQCIFEDEKGTKLLGPEQTVNLR